ncbi:mitochondrial carrier protein [Talaromyces pinophilus]|uniref:Mitochondrial carrier protein n=1 Tax=Talaromyces pinophilus TaxID=128442 RepID=A0A6V8HBY0_TALPI|nr:mitochondrial carrier protein [Talaromyces pinophilus]
MIMSSDDSAPRPVVRPEQQEYHEHHAPTHLPSSMTAPTPYGKILTRLEIASTHIPSFYITPFCGAMAGVASGIVTCPLDVIKTKLQAQGLTPALLGLSHVAIQFPLYEYFKMAFTGYGIGEHPDEGDSHWVGISLATFLSKVCASTATYPHEVLRTRLQTQQRHPPASSPEEIAFRGGLDHPADRGRPPGAASSDGMPNRPRYAGVWRTCQTILREEGWRAFYSGIGTNLIRAVPAAMTTMLTYEYLRKTISTLQHEGQKKLDDVNAEGDTLI